MIPRFPIVSLLSVLLAMSTVSCAPNSSYTRYLLLDVRDLKLSQEIVDHLPKDQAFKFLQSLRAESQLIKIDCRFEEDGVFRGQKGDSQSVSEKHPYTSFEAGVYLPENPQLGHESFITLILNHSYDSAWCVIAIKANANQHGKEAKPFMVKILTALLSMGVRVKGLGGETTVRARKPTSQ